MQVENDSDKEVYNGDLGVVSRIDMEKGELAMTSTAAKSLTALANSMSSSRHRAVLSCKRLLEVSRPYDAADRGDLHHRCCSDPVLARSTRRGQHRIQQIASSR